MRCFPLLAVSLLFLCSCALESQSYVDQNLGYSSTKGTIVRIDNIGCDLAIQHGKTHLGNGMVFEVDRPGGTVTLQIGENFQQVNVPVGSRLVFSESGDYLLQPLDNLSAEPVPQP